MSTVIQQRFNRMVIRNERIYRSSDQYIKAELKRRKKSAKHNNRGKVPYIESGKGAQIYKCFTCGTVNKSHPVTSYCFVCDTDNWSLVTKD